MFNGVISHSSFILLRSLLFGLSGVLLYIAAVYLFVIFFFFFQAEDGIRYLTVTGVQTCALPISGSPVTASSRRASIRVNLDRGRRETYARPMDSRWETEDSLLISSLSQQGPKKSFPPLREQIGRASCRERVEIQVDRVPVKKHT